MLITNYLPKDKTIEFGREVNDSKRKKGQISENAVYFSPANFYQFIQYI